MKFKYLLHRYRYPIVGVAILILISFSVVLFGNGDDWKIVWPIIGGAVSLLYIIEKQQLDEALLFKQLFTEFNGRYDSMNETLNTILRDKPTTLTNEQIECLNDYFNLCGEEFLYFRNGFIYPEVWQSWLNGMKTYYSNDLIKAVWNKELESASYYGLETVLKNSKNSALAKSD